MSRDATAYLVASSGRFLAASRELVPQQFNNCLLAFGKNGAQGVRQRKVLNTETTGTYDYDYLSAPAIKNPLMVQPIAFGVLFLQCQNLIDYLVLDVSFAMFR